MTIKPMSLNEARREIHHPDPPYTTEEVLRCYALWVVEKGKPKQLVRGYDHSDSPMDCYDRGVEEYYAAAKSLIL